MYDWEDWVPIFTSRRTRCDTDVFLMDILLAKPPRQLAPTPREKKQQDLNNFLEELKKVSKYRRIIPIGRPPDDFLWQGTILICDMCQHTTKFQGESHPTDESFIKPKIFCSNKKCNRDLFNSNYEYLNDPRIPKLEPIDLPLMGWTDTSTSLCSRCRTKIPFEHPSTLAHPYWKSCSQLGGYCGEMKEGPSFMICCQCHFVCGLDRYQLGEDEEKPEDASYGYHLVCSRACGHVRDYWKDCENCVRLVEELPPVEGSLTQVQEKEEEQDGF